MAKPATRSRERLSRQIFSRMLLWGIAIVAVATVISYYQVFHQSKETTLAYLRQYMAERQQRENETFAVAAQELAFFRDEFLKLYDSPIDFTEQDFWDVYARDKDGAVRMNEDRFAESFHMALGRNWGVTSFIGNNQSVASTDFRRRLLLSAILVNRYGPAWQATGMLHVSFPENAITIFSPDDPWGLKARPDLPMNELGTIKATLQTENPERKPVWTGLYYDETVDNWTITFELPVDKDGRHLVNPSLDVSLASIMGRLDTEHPQGADNFIVSKNGYLIAHPGPLKQELRRKGQLSLDKLGDPDLSRRFALLTANVPPHSTDVAVVEDKAGDALLLVAPLAGPEWWFVMAFPERLIAREAHKASRVVLVLGLSLFVLYSIGIHVIIARQVRLPLERLQKAVWLVGEGRYRQVIGTPEALPLEQRNEIGQLAGSFLDMCREVEDVNANLHQIVESRTRELEEANAKLRQLSLLDPLTGIHNRRSFDRDLARVFAQARGGVDSFCLLLVDIDGFKHYNDTNGHVAGDEALRRIAAALAAGVRAGDRVYRYGGEELAVICNNADLEAAGQASQRLLQAVRDLDIVHEGSPCGVVTASAGLAAWSPEQADAAALVDAADRNLYRAKAAGRNCLRAGAAS